jgi:hypothetical protein
MSMADHLIEQCQRRGVAIKVVGDDLEIEFNSANPPHDLINDLRLYKADVIRRLRGEPSEQPRYRDSWRPPLSTSEPDGGGNSGAELGRLFTGPRAI